MSHVRPPRPVSLAGSKSPTLDPWEEESDKPIRTGITLKQSSRVAFWNRAKQAYTNPGDGNKQTRLKFWILLVFIVTSLVLSVLILRVFAKNDNEESGIVTLSVRAVYNTSALNR
jgi:preprotein translocase subunit SecG